MLYRPLMYHSNIPRWFNEAMTSAERIFDVIDQELDIKDKDKQLK